MRDFNAPKCQTSSVTGTMFWLRFGILHREDGPAVIYTNGDEEWIKYGKFHREDGPAVIKEDGRNYWYIHGVPVRTFEEYQLRSRCTDEVMSFLKIKHGAITSPKEEFISFQSPGDPNFD